MLTMMGERRFIGGKGLPTDAGMHVPLIVSWPGKAVPGEVSHDLVDTTDFLPTVCEAAGVLVPAELRIDGRSFLAQVRGEKGNPRDCYYSWYGPQKEKGIVAEFAATQDYKLSRTGDFYDLRKDIEEKHPLKVAALDGEAAAAAKLLKGPLDQYKDARPAAIAMPFVGSKMRGDPERSGKAPGKKKNAKGINKAINSANELDEGL
jgi:arylsulfatase A